MILWIDSQTLARTKSCMCFRLLKIIFIRENPSSGVGRQDTCNTGDAACCKDSYTNRIIGQQVRWIMALLHIS